MGERDLDILPARTGTAVRLAPGDYIVLRAEMDCIVALSACPHDIFPVNGAGATPRDVADTVTRA